MDINIIIPKEIYEQKLKDKTITYWENAGDFYNGGYFDGKYITLDYLSLVADRGNEPTRFALQDSIIAFDRTGKVADLIKKVGTYNTDSIKENAIRFLSQFEAWNWYCKEAVKKNNRYLLDVSVSKLVLFAGRLILLENKSMFPYHKWFIKMLEKVEQKPVDFIPKLQCLLSNKSLDNIREFYECVKNYKDWAEGEKYSWTSHFVYDIETVWTRQEEFIENI